MTCQWFLRLFDTECIVTQLYHIYILNNRGKLQEKISFGRKIILKNISLLFFGVNVNVLKWTSLQALWNTLQPLKHWRKVVLSNINIKKCFLNLIREMTMILSNNFIYPMSYNSNVLKMKTSWYLCRKINFKFLINNQLGPARRVNIFKVFGYLSRPFALSPIFQPWAP